MVNFGLLAAEIGWEFGASSKFQRVSRLGFVTAPTSFDGGQPRFAQSLAVSCDVHSTLCIHFRGLFAALAPNGILPGAKFTLRPSLAFSYIGRVTAWHSSSGRQPSCGVEQTAPPIFGRADITLGISLHSSLCLFYANVSGCFYHFDNKIGLKNTIVRSIWSS